MRTTYGFRSVILAPLAVLLTLACTPGERRGRVLVIGIDGASEKVIGPLVYAESLPHLAALREAGAVGRMQPELPLLSPIIWTSVATGKSERGHGIKGWVWRDEAGELHLYSSRDRKAHALWNVLSDRGFEVAVVNWLVTHPPEVINGVMISDHALPGVVQQQKKMARQLARQLYPDAEAPPEDAAPGAPYASPETWVERLATLRTDDDPLTPIENPFPGPKPGAVPPGPLLKFLHDMHSIFENDGAVVRAALAVEAELEPDLLMVYLPGIDRVSHYLWVDRLPHDSGDPELHNAKDERVRRAAFLATYYRYTDALIGRLLERYGKNDLVIVLSDHGFESATEGPNPGTHKTLAARDGIFYARGPGIAPGQKNVTIAVHGIAPAILAWFGLPPAQDMEGRAPPFLGLDAIAPIASYDTTPIDRLAGDSGVEDERIDELRSVGYVD